jgi:hypothetical protein
MKRVGVVGLCLVAMLAFCAMVTAAAQAAEVVSCVKVAKMPVMKKDGKSKKISEGKYTNKACTDRAPEKTGKFPSYEGPEGKYERRGAGAKFTTRNKKNNKNEPKPKLEMVDPGLLVRCGSSQGQGEWTGTKTGVAAVVFMGCVLENTGAVCTTAGLEPGEIETSPLDLTLIAYPEELQQEYFNENNEVEATYPFQPLPGHPFVESSAAPGHAYYLEYACEGDLYRSAGTVAGRVRSERNKMSKTMVWYDGPGEGVQDLRSEVSTNGGESYTPLGGATRESYEAVATDKAKLEVIEEE